MLPTLDIGPFVIPTAGLVLILGIWLSLGVVERAAGWLGQDKVALYALAATSLFAGMVGARLLFVALHWQAYRDNPLGLIWPLTSGFDLWGGLLVGLAAGLLVGRKHQLAPAATPDALAPGLLVGLMVVSLADFLAGPGFGTISNVPWAISQFGLRRHPVQLYEIGVGLAALGVWWRLHGRPAYAGQLFLVTLAIYSSGRLLVEAFRDNAWLTAGGYHVVQIICLLLALGSLYLLSRLAGRPAADTLISPSG